MGQTKTRKQPTQDTPKQKVFKFYKKIKKKTNLLKEQENLRVVPLSEATAYMDSLNAAKKIGNMVRKCTIFRYL